MKTNLILPDLLALLEIVNEHVDRNFPGGESPKILNKLQLKLRHMAGMYNKESGQIPDKSGKVTRQKTSEGKAGQRSSKVVTA